MNENEIKLEIKCQSDRERIVLGLANSGYKVWVKSIYSEITLKTIDYVIFEVNSEKSKL